MKILQFLSFYYPFAKLCIFCQLFEKLQVCEMKILHFCHYDPIAKVGQKFSLLWKFRDANRHNLFLLHFASRCELSKTSQIANDDFLFDFQIGTRYERPISQPYMRTFLTMYGNSCLTKAHYANPVLIFTAFATKIFALISFTHMWKSKPPTIYCSFPNHRPYRKTSIRTSILQFLSLQSTLNIQFFVHTDSKYFQNP